MFLRGNILENLKYYINYLFVHFWNYHHKNSINKKLKDISAKAKFYLKKSQILILSIL